MAARLVQAGYEVAVCGSGRRDLSAYASSTGARLAQNPREVARTARIFFTMIPDAAALRSVVSQVEELDLTGKILVDMSTVDPAASAEAAGRIEAAGGQFLRAPVTGSTHFAAAGTLGIMVSGPRRAFESCLPYLKVLGNRQTYLGEGEQARQMKILINMLLAEELQALSEALVVGGRLGLPWETMLDLIAGSAAAAPIYCYKADTLKRRDFTPTSTGYNMHKDMKMAMALADSVHVSAPAAQVAMEMYERLMDMGMGQIDNTAVLLVNERRNAGGAEAR